MSLPQRKKSAEEIAKLRESLGISGHIPEEDAPLPESPAAAVVQPVAGPAEIPLPVAPLPSPSSPLPANEPKLEPVAGMHQPPSRMESVPVLEAQLSGLDAIAAAEPEVIPRSAASHSATKQVRSLRKSEQGPVPTPHPVDGNSPLPSRRHSAQEIKTIRRHEALAPHAAVPHPLTLRAHPVVYVPAYLLAIAGAVCAFIYDLALAYPAACEALVLLIAAFIFFKKPLSRHHAAFIAVVALLVIVFGALHYFPNLKYGT